MTSEFNIAVHALVFLDHKACVVSSEELSQNICTNPARVRKILASLKKAGLVDTKEGAEGGYHFVLDADGVSLARIARAVGARFVSASWHSGGADKECLVSSGMAQVMEEIYQDLDTLCKQRLETMTVATIRKRIFGE